MTASASVVPGHPAAATPATEPSGADLLRAPHREPTRALEAMLGAVVLFSWVPPGFPQFLSMGLTAMVLLVGLGLTRRPTFRLGGFPNRLGWLVPLLVATLVWCVGVTLMSPDGSLSGWEKRAVRLVLVGCFLVVLVTGRIHYPSVVRGATLGLVANVVLFYIGLAPTPYGEYLSGYLLDKNQAGLVCAVVGLLYAGLHHGSIPRTGLTLAVTAAVVWTTGSRTSLAALVCGAAWLYLAPRLHRKGRVLLALLLYGFVQVLNRDFARVGVFADRDGTDALRERIDAAATLKLDAAPPWGQGLGEAYVYLEGRVFFFHNSYAAAMLEAGWVLVAVYVGLTLLVGVGLLRRQPVPPAWAGAEAGNVAVLVCALRLGEVFGAATATLALAGAVLALMARRQDADPPPDPPAALESVDGRVVAPRP